MPSAALCRAQQAFHRDRAQAAVLDNVRIVSEKAAVAWGREVLLAEERETRHERRRAISDAIESNEPLDEPLPRSAHDRLFSENPDRGFAAGQHGAGSERQ